MLEEAFGAISTLRQNLDDQSPEIIDQKLEHLLNLPAFGTKYQRNMRAIDRRKILYTPSQNEAMRQFRRSLRKIRKKYKLKTYLPEVVFYEHGLKLTQDEPRLKSYLQNKLLVDCGASYGDSAVVLKKRWQFAKVYSFELTNHPETAESNYFSTIRANSLDAKDFHLETKGVGLHNAVGDNIVQIDDYEYSGQVGVIKVDIEGSAFDAICGAEKTIRESEPVLLIACYHSPREFFQIKPLVDSWSLGYTFHLRNLNYITNSELETTLICLPPRLKGLEFQPV